MNRIFFSTILSTAVALQPALAAAALTQIGAAAGVRGTPKAISEGASVGRVVESGKPIFLNDHVTTDDKSKMQVMLKDETVFTLGPNADMVLDEFVYDPATQAGKVTATVTKGVFRFVTGKIAGNQPSNMKVKLPVGTIGIRGTIVAGIASPGMCAAMLAGPGAGNNANAKAGAFSLSNGMGSTEVKVSGEGSMITAGGAPTPAGPLPASVLGQINAGLASKPSSDSNDDESGSAKTDESSDGDSASEQSGDTTAAGQESAGESEGTAEVAQALSDTATQASLDNTRLTAGVADGLAKWDTVRGVTGFTGWFFGITPISCTGCQSNPVGAVQLWFDTGSKILGGSGAFAGPEGGSNSFIHLHNVFSPGDTVQSIISSSIGYGNTSSFPDGTNAVYTPSLGAVTGCAVGVCSFSGTTIQLNNKGGVAAAEAQANFQFNNSGAVSSSGVIVAPR